MEKITDNMKYIVSEGDVVTIHSASWDYSKRIGEPFEAIVLWGGIHGQPLVTKMGEYRPFWSTYASIVKINGHINLDRLFGTNRRESMEDRYLFKVKTCNGEWVAGFLHCKNDKWYISNKAGSPFAFEVRPDTICQCTGLKDKNGKLIWENDVVKCKVGTAKVIWDKSEWRIEWVETKLWRRDLYYWAAEDIQRIEVIGNIFDNPELLESEG